MFERYTERARRALFFARYEASQMGGTSIETEHLLLGLLRESKGVVGIVFSRSHLTLDRVAAELDRRSPARKKLSTSEEIPFSAGAKHVLLFAAEEADRLLHRHIGPEHLLLGLLREDRSVGASILRQHGLVLDEVRREIARIVEPDKEEPSSDLSVDDARARVDGIKVMVLQLAEVLPDSSEARELTDVILAALEDLKDRFGE